MLFPKTGSSVSRTGAGRAPPSSSSGRGCWVVSPSWSVIGPVVVRSSSAVSVSGAIVVSVASSRAEPIT